MHWLQQVDIALFRFINQSLANPVFDWLMPFASGNDFFIPALAIIAALLLWKGGRQGQLFLLALVLALLVTDLLVVNNLKKLVGRERPFLGLENVNLLVGKGGSGSFPSAHAANWFAGLAVALVYYPRSWRFMLPLACVVAISRVYNGVHYPADIAAGATIGAAAGFATVWLMNTLWCAIGRRWFPLWWQELPSLVRPTAKVEPAQRSESSEALQSKQWFRLGCLLIGAVVLGRLIYIASGTIELSEDEAYYWLWSKEPAMAYYSKPPLVAYTIALGTLLWGDTHLGIRFFSPVIGALIAFLMLRFFTREVSARSGVALVLICMAVPLLGVGTVLMTIDPLSVLFWVAAMLAGWQSIQATGRTRDWAWVGLWMGLGLFAKYVAFLQLLCWAFVFLLLPFARQHLKKPGPYLALVVQALFLVPVLIWNQQHDWITVKHVSESTHADTSWQPTLRYLNDFFWSEVALLNPFFFTAAWIAGVGVWRRKVRDQRELYFFCMGAPLFLFLMVYSLKGRILPNWVAPSIVPLLAMTVMYWSRPPVTNLPGNEHVVLPRWIPSWAFPWIARAVLHCRHAWSRRGNKLIERWSVSGVVFGLFVGTILHNTDLIERVTGNYLPAKLDPLRRVRAWEATAEAVGKARNQLLQEGKPVFVIGHHYGLTSQLSFYMPESQKALHAGSRLAYFKTSEKPENQFFFWPGYQDRKGQNAIFAVDFSPKSRIPKAGKPPHVLLEEFESVTDLGLQPVKYEGRALRWIQLFECRGLR